MKSLKLGFTSFELIMVMAVSAIMMTVLFEIYNQVTKNMARVERFIFEDSQVLALKNRFGKDISGMSAIWFVYKPKADQKAAASRSDAPDKKMKSKYFYSVNKDGHLDTLTFLTTNALQSYGSVQHRFIRVVYQVEQDPKHENLFRLMRKEIVIPSQDIDEQTLQQGKAYELVSGIKSIEISYQLVDTIELKKQYDEKNKAGAQEKNKAAEKAKESKPVVRVVKEWNLADIAKEEKKAKKAAEDQEHKDDVSGAAVPKFIEMKIIFGKTDQQIEKSYKLEFVVPSIVGNVPKNVIEETALVPDQGTGGGPL